MILNEIYLKTCRVISPFGYSLYARVVKIAGPSFKNIAFRTMEKFLRLTNRFKGTKIYTTYKSLKLKLSFDDAFYSGLLFYGVIDAYETQLMEKIIKKGDVVIDVGAFVDGWYTLFPAALVGEEGHVYSFEPAPEYYKRLKENIALNKLKNITLVKKGVYDKAKTLSFYVAEGRSSLLKEQAESYKKTAAPKVTIQTVTLDSFITFNKIKKVSFIKVDVEGVEMNVLRGAIKTLKRMHPNLIIEIVDEQLKLGGSSKKEVITFLENLGYSTYAFMPEGVMRYRNNQELKTNNLFFSTQKF